MRFLSLQSVAWKTSDSEKSDELREMGVELPPDPWTVIDCLVQVDKIQDAWEDSPRDDPDRDFCSVRLDSGDEIMLAMSLAEFQARLVQVGEEVLP